VKADNQIIGEIKGKMEPKDWEQTWNMNEWMFPFNATWQVTKNKYLDILRSSMTLPNWVRSYGTHEINRWINLGRGFFGWYTSSPETDVTTKLLSRFCKLLTNDHMIHFDN
jgi:hypothetical protein